MYLCDFHIHSTFSDGKLTIPDLVDFYGSRGFGAIGITDHVCERLTLIGRVGTYLGQSLTPATFPIYMEILRSEAERAWRQYRMVVIPGYELSKNSVSNARSAHIIGLGVNKFMWADGPVEKLCDDIRAQGAITIAAHPVSTRKLEKQTYHLWDRREQLAPYFDAWEVASGPFIFDEVLRANLPKIASSDLHHPKQIRAWKTVLDCEKTPEAILDAIRKQNVSFRFHEEAKDDGSARVGISMGNGPGANDLRDFLIPEAL